MITPGVARSLPLPDLPARGVAASFAAYVGTLPAVATAFGRAAPISIGSNLVAVPLCAGTLLAALAAVGILDVPWAGDAAAGATRWLARSLLGTGSVAAGIGGSGRTVSGSSARAAPSMKC